MGDITHSSIVDENAGFGASDAGARAASQNFDHLGSVFLHEANGLHQDKPGAHWSLEVVIVFFPCLS